ncbi:5-Enolpyruvylshikimate-3-phosphate synthase [Arcticibacter svalbardensis MN12-7]|uniref:3-phosphoshikimate 1-carboxyvinyltransferase n=1 Tax=Arcticibacter svalbardensis MN12-7 TaxID=1150600 RepID=R9GRK4_9SPHI|nr:3-phosphoshikimate 1-carboxyvinyltransferase [Arcticibacter svalbardensis]EOR94482.1 5-Enolpyruvylshikimate-3-phosphate synthase [Arcticibacter svalbardensis MN12-7]
MAEKSNILSKSEPDTFCKIQLTGSKSESNRALILKALSKGKVAINNLSSADDTVILNGVLEAFEKGINEASFGTGSLKHLDGQLTANIGPAGTAMRFLSAYLAVTGTEAQLTGSDRMKQRPIGILVDALSTLGANINYDGEEGYPPLKFSPDFKQKANVIHIQGNVSSQYLSALLLVSPYLRNGLELHIDGELTSRPYVEMTLSMLKEVGIEHSWTGSIITIAHQPFINAQITIEPDWSAASYWYAIAALSDNATITLPYLKKNSLQGDSRIASIMQSFGIKSTFTESGLMIEKTKGRLDDSIIFDLRDCPDLAQTIIVCSAALGNDATFTGLETLKIKETDRILALQTELAKIGVTLSEEYSFYHLDCSKLHFPEKLTIKTYEDHRMAMAFAPLALKIPQLEIEDPQVVGKSYPTFWDDLLKAGFHINTN